MSNARDIGWYLNEWLGLLKMNQKEFAQATGWTQGYVSMLCAGKRGYSQKCLEITASALGLHPSELLMPPPRALRIRKMLAAGESPN